MKLLFLFVLFVPIALFSQQNGQSNYSKQLVEIQTSKLTPTQPQKIKQSFSSSSTSENRNTYPMTISSTDNAQISQPKPVRWMVCDS